MLEPENSSSNASFHAPATPSGLELALPTEVSDELTAVLGAVVERAAAGAPLLTGGSGWFVEPANDGAAPTAWPPPVWPAPVSWSADGASEAAPPPVCALTTARPSGFRSAASRSMWTWIAARLRVTPLTVIANDRCTSLNTSPAYANVVCAG